MTKQGLGHISLEWDGRDNKEVLEDVEVSAEHKRKIKLIEKYKDYFYEYFKLDKKPIYGQTTFLKNTAVTYLVIASPKDEIKAVRHSFPFVGEFPYKGFFNKDDANEFMKEQEKQNLSTYMRPVYAYSTLDRTPFDDNILSSFFYYNDEQLAQLIFHELTHTIFFIEDEISLNESLAEVISDDLVVTYFKRKQEDVDLIILKQKKDEKIREAISNLTKQLNLNYKRDKDYSQVLETFLTKKFYPTIESICKAQKIKQCWPLKHTWNNARFAAFSTYQTQQNFLKDLKTKLNLSTRDFLSLLQKEYAQFSKSDIDKTFKSYLMKRYK
jgi:predicted aminopeptidase